LTCFAFFQRKRPGNVANIRHWVFKGARKSLIANATNAVLPTQFDNALND